MQNLKLYNNDWYNTGAGFVKRTLWYYINVLIFNHGLFPFNGLKIKILRIFGAKIGQSVIIKPSVNIKYPWFLHIGNDTWIGEKVWIDNLIEVRIGNNCCISQGAMLLTGNHNFKSENFDLITKSIIIEDHVWIGAKALVGPGVICAQNSILSMASVASKDLEKNTIYRGNPAIKVGIRP